MVRNSILVWLLFLTHTTGVYAGGRKNVTSMLSLGGIGGNERLLGVQGSYTLLGGMGAHFGHASLHAAGGISGGLDAYSELGVSIGYTYRELSDEQLFVSISAFYFYAAGYDTKSVYSQLPDLIYNYAWDIFGGEISLGRLWAFPDGAGGHSPTKAHGFITRGRCGYALGRDGGFLFTKESKYAGHTLYGREDHLYASLSLNYIITF